MKNSLATFRSSSKKERLLTVIRLLTAIIISGLVALVFCYNFLSLFTPFAAYSRFRKLIEFVCSFGIFFILFIYFYFRILIKKLRLIGKWWWTSILVAIVFSLAVYALSYAHGPIYPSKVSISIRTDSSLGYVSTQRRLSNNTKSYIDLPSEVSGKWNNVEGVYVHQGSGIGKLEYEGFEYVTTDTTYSFRFIPQNYPANVRIEINGILYDLQIPTSETYPDPFVYRINVHSQEPASLLWKLWLFAFPFLRWLSLFIYFFAASILIWHDPKRRGDIVWGHIGLFILSLLFFTALLLQNEFVNFYTYKIHWLVIAITGFILTPILLIWLLRKFPKTKIPIIVLVFLLAIGLRVYWILMVPSGQISDFGRFHYWALQLARGEPGLVMDRYSVFTRLVGLIYKIYPGHEIIEGVNVLFSLITMFSIWGIGKTLKAENAGIIGAYLFAIFPSEISFTGLVCTDIIAVGLLTLCAYLLIKFIQTPKYHLLLLGALTYGFSIALRLPLLIYGLIFILPFVINQKTIRKRDFLLKLLFMVLGITGGFYFIKGIVSTLSVDDMEINESRNVIFTLLNGTNIEALGRNNKADEALVYSWKESEVARNGLQVVADRLAGSPIGFFSILKYKYAYQFGDATYGSNTAFLGEDMDFATFTTYWPFETYAIRSVFARLSQFAYWMILGCACFVLFKPIDGNRRTALILSMTVIVSAFSVYSLFEVQPRYQRPIIPFIIILAAMAFMKQREITKDV